MLLRQGPPVYCQFEARQSALLRDQPPPGLCGSKRAQSPQQGFLTPHRTPVGPREAEEEGGGSGRRGSFPFPALHPWSVGPSSFPSHCRGREMPVGLEFPSKLLLLCWDSPLPLSVSLGQAWGKPNKQKQEPPKIPSCFYWSRSIMINLRNRDKNGIAPLRRGREVSETFL